jgi:TonB-linked SusC/RagA family outer membrane protein
LPGVSVAVRGASPAVGTITDADGNYTLSGVNSNATLVFSYIGFSSQEVAVGGRSTVNMTLAENVSALDEVVVTGIGQARRRGDITGSIGTVSTEQIEKSTSLTPEMALQGQVAGVTVTSGGSDPTSRPTVRVRGVSTFGYADPLYVIDGIPVVEGGAGVNIDAVNGGTLRGPVNIYTLINPADIETMSVLKDAAATAIYGVRGANGVILITTKRGQKGKVRVDFDAQQGTVQVPKTHDVLNTQQYVDFFTKSYAANPDLLNGVPRSMYRADHPDFGPIYDPTNTARYIGNNPTTDWQDVVQNKDAGIANYNIRASGGSESTTYNFSAGYSKNDGPLLGNSAERYNVSSKIISQVNKYIESGLNVRLVNENSQQGLNNYSPDAAFRGTPFQQLYDPNGWRGYAGLYNYTGPITKATDFTDPTQISKRWGPNFTSYDNPLGQLAASDNNDNHQTILGDIYVQVQPIAGLRLKGTFGGQNLRIDSRNFTDENAWQFGQTPNNPYQNVTAYTPGGVYNSVAFRDGKTVSLQSSFNASYTKTIATKHNIDLLFDASQQVFRWDIFSASGFVDNSDEMRRGFGGENVTDVGGGVQSKYALIGYLGRIAYNFNNKYYIEGLVRRDGSSRFAPQNRWGTFPAFSAGWRISQENFMKGFSFINDLKIRGSYGILGNEQTTAGWRYLSLPAPSAPSYALGNNHTNNIGVAYRSIANIDLTWEKKYSGNIGFDAALLNNSVNLTVEYYNQVTKGIIQPFSPASSFGVADAVDVNIADVLNRGMEFTLGYNKKFGEIGFNASANLTTLKNEVLKLADNNRADRFSGREVGRPLGFIYGYQVGGIFQDDAEAAQYFKDVPNDAGREKRAGDIWYKDLNGAPEVGSNEVNVGPDGKLNSNDQTYLGNTIPKLSYGLNLGSSFKNFDLSVFFRGIGGVQRYNYARAGGEGTGAYGRNLLTSVLNSWTPENRSTTMPRAVYGDPGDNFRFSDRYVENAGYFRLQNLTIGYTLPKSLVAKTRALQNLRLYATGINLFTVTSYTGLDPDTAPASSQQNDQGGGRLGFATRQFLFGLRAAF